MGDGSVIKNIRAVFQDRFFSLKIITTATNDAAAINGLTGTKRTDRHEKNGAGESGSTTAIEVSLEKFLLLEVISRQTNERFLDFYQQ